MRCLTLALLWLAGSASVAAAEPLTLVAWAPGYPGTTEQAQPSMDEFAAGVAAAAGWTAAEFRAVYYPKVADGRERLAAGDAALVIVPLPVYLEFGESLGLRPLLRVIQQGGDEETWSLVAHKGALHTASDLSGWSLEGHAGFSARFVKRVLASWGTLPDDVEIGFNARVLSVLREAAHPSSETILASAPEVIIELRADGATENDIVRGTAAWQRFSTVPAVRGGRVHFLTGPELVVPGPRVAEVTRRIAELLHPDAF